MGVDREMLLRKTGVDATYLKVTPAAGRHKLWLVTIKDD
jgi:hypothetical protein